MISISNPLLGFAVIILSGYIGGYLASRINLPQIIGNLFAGLILGPFCLKILSHQLILHELSPIDSIAFGFIAVSIALHFKIEEFKKIFILSFFDVSLTFSFITVISLLITSSLPLSLLFGITGATTAPAASLAIVRETRAKGPLVSALLPTIALNNVMCIIIFTFIIGTLETIYGRLPAILPFIKNLIIASLLGILVGLLLSFIIPFTKKLKIKTIWVSFLSLMILIGISEELKISSLLSSICMGLVITNKKNIAEEVFDAFNKLESFVYLFFFTASGAHLNPAYIPKEWELILIFVISRFACKIAAGALGASVIRLKYKGLFGIGLLPQAGLALAFLLLVQEKGFSPNLINIYSTVILSAVIINEFGGSIATRLLIRLVKEEGKAYPPVFGFINSGDILIGLEAEDKWEAITKLVHQLCKRKGIDLSQEGKILEKVIERELSMTTAVGRYLAIPHGFLEDESERIIGIFAICHKGIDFGSMDGKAVHFIILSLVPEKRLEDHLRYLTEISRIFSKPFIYSALMEAKTEEEVLRILQEAQQ